MIKKVNLVKNKKQKANNIDLEKRIAYLEQNISSGGSGGSGTSYEYAPNIEDLSMTRTLIDTFTINKSDRT